MNAKQWYQRRVAITAGDYSSAIMMLTILTLFCLLVSCTSFKYDGFHSFQVGPLKSLEQVQLIRGLIDQDERLKQVMLLNDEVLRNRTADLIINPQVVKGLKTLLDNSQISYTITNTDLQRLIDDEVSQASAQRAQRGPEGTRFGKFDHTAYLTYEEQIAWLNSAAASYPLLAQTFSIGRSTQNRELVVFSINEALTHLPTVFVDSGIHAREWISHATNMYLIEEILTGKDADALSLRNNYRWYFLVNVNPDGYAYTWSTDRLWRKTRSNNPGSLCVGTDANRNWDSNWGGEGSSPNPCSDTYHGSKAFSEPETHHESVFLKSISSGTNLLISMHCYSQLWLVPWGGYAVKPIDYNELMRVADLAVKAIKTINGLTFVAGTPPDLLYVASGGTFDYAKEKLGIKYSYTPELRPANNLQGGFTIPPSNIIPSGKEIFAALVATVNNVHHN